MPVTVELSLSLGSRLLSGDLSSWLCSKAKGKEKSSHSHIPDLKHLFSNHFQLFLRLSKSDDFILGSAGVATASALVKVSTFESASFSFPPNPFLDDGSGLHASGLGVGDTAPALYLFDGVP